MRVLVLGGSGMLGHKALQVLSGRFETMATVRRFDDRLRSTGLFSAERVFSCVDAENFDSVRKAVNAAKPDCVLNCIGVIKQLDTAKHATTTIQVNALFPHLLAELCSERGARLIHVSTDCVFSGRRGNYSESDNSDAEDLYGRAKYLGEIADSGCLTIRTSIIGRELFTNLALVEWFLSQRGGTVRGFTNAIFSGLTTTALSHEIGRLIDEYPALSGVFHVSADRITKYDLLLLLRSAYGVDVVIEPDGEVRCDRSLDSWRYRQATGFRPQKWEAMVEEMARDATPYEEFRRRVPERSTT